MFYISKVLLSLNIKIKQIEIMTTVTINSVKYNVSLEMNKFLKENKKCKQTFSFLFNLGLKSGQIVKL